MVTAMQRPFRARVGSGRIVLDEPTDLPEGDVELVPVHEVLARSGEYLDAEYRAALHRSIQERVENSERDDTSSSSPIEPLQARVRNGRIVLDEPIDLPEGEGIELVPLDEVLAHGGDYLDDEDRAALHRELDVSIAEAEAGQFIDADLVLAELRARR
jgi:hypothetical protein